MQHAKNMVDTASTKVDNTGMKKALLSFVGFHDPYSDSGVQGLKHPGPIISMLNARSFDIVFLFDTPGTHCQLELTCAAIRKHFPDITVEVMAMETLTDPTDHIRILRYLRRYIDEIAKKHTGTDWSISVSSGTPSMHACWILLVADGTINAKLLYGHPPRDPSAPYPVFEIDITAMEFPTIEPRVLPATIDDMPDVEPVCAQLGIIGSDKSFTDAIERSARLARYDSHVLLLGETGVGKERFAELIHRMSRRANQPFVIVNSGAIPSNLGESILFGHKRGAFTGAVADQIGEFSRADGGTIFLDEIGNMDMQTQAKILRVMQDGHVRPLGSDKSTPVNVRVVAATNADLAQSVKNNDFRADLIQRFAAVVEIPPLRRRRGDIVKLALFTMEHWRKRYDEDRRLSRAALAKLENYNWPGNVRELINVVESAAMTARKNIISEDDINFGGIAWTHDGEVPIPDPAPGFNMRKYLESARIKLIKRAMEMTNGNQRRAAALLGVSPQAIHKAKPMPDNF